MPTSSKPPPESDRIPPTAVSPKLRHALALLFIAAVAFWNFPSGYPHRVTGNLNVAEGYAWWQGRLDLDSPIPDYAYFNGKVYNVYPPLVSILAAAARPLFPNGVPGWIIIPILIAPVILLSYLLFVRLTGTIPRATILTLFWVFGTPLYPILIHAKLSGAVYHVNHAFSQIGILLILYEVLGRQRAVPMGLGLIITAWTRQLTAAYLFPVAWCVWKNRARRPHDVKFLGLTVILCTAVPMTLNTLKFENPFQTGYLLIGADYQPHPEGIGPWHGLFSPRYIPQNLYYTHLRPPPLAFDKSGKLRYVGESFGSSLWITCPVLLLFWLDIRTYWRDPLRRILLLSMLVVALVLLTYFNTGAHQKGYARFSLDYLAPMLALMAPRLLDGHRRWIALPLMFASMVYFRWIMDFLFDYRVIFEGLSGS